MLVRTSNPAHQETAKETATYGIPDPRRTPGLLAKSSPGAGFTTPRTVINVCYRTTNTGTLPSARTSDV
jgi:hypothetical protein